MNRNQIKAVVGSVFRSPRRIWKGYGGVPNPKETWQDLKASIQTAFLLDSDSVFTVAAWAAARLIGQCNKLLNISADMKKAAGELVDSSTGIPDLTKINAAARRLRSVITDIRISSNSLASPDARAEVRRNLVSFAKEALVPNVSPSTDGTSRRSASEARKSLRENIDLLINIKSDIADSVVRLAALISVLYPRMPHLLASGILQKAANNLDDMRSRMVESRSEDRINNAEADLTNVATAIVALDLITRNPIPTLYRGGPYAVVGAGSGVGAVKLGSVSAPYRLVEGVSSSVRLDVDGAAGSVVLLPTSPDSFEVRFPRPDPYSATVNWEFAIAVDGTAGNPISGVPGSYTAANIADLINSTPGAIPSVGGVSALIVSAIPAGGGSNTVRFQWNPAAYPTSPKMDLGRCIQFMGTTEMMNNFGFTGSDPEFPEFQYYRQFWKPARQAEVISSLNRSYGAGILIEPDNTTIMSGIGWFDDGAPTYFYVWHFNGLGELNDDRTRLILTGDGLGKVVVGDHVDIGPGAATARVSKKLPDGVMIDSWAGIPLSAGTYGVSIYPNASTIDPTTTPTLHILENGQDVAYHVVGASNTGAGLRLQLSTDLYVGAFYSLTGAGSNHVQYALRMDRLKISSRNNGTTGSLQFQPVAHDAASYLGYDHSISLSQVSQIDCATADFLAAGVKPGDIVSMPGLPSNTVESVIDKTRIRLKDMIPGTYTGTVQIINAKYNAYNNMTAALSWIVPTDAELRRLVLECLRAPAMSGAGAELAAKLTTIESATVALKLVLETYRTAMRELSPYMKNVREALDESGADRALALLVSGDLKALFDAEVDDASTERMVLRKIRETSRRILGSSVYSNQLNAEARAMLPDDKLLPDSGPLSEESFGPPRGA